jgi:four helix bundle protein
MSASYKDLIVWQKAMSLAEEVYRQTRDFPREEQFGLVSQLRRAAVSVPSNIAEGQGRLNPGEFRQFLGQARGSLLEVRTQAELATRLGYLPEPGHNKVQEQAQEVLRLLNGLISKLETRN